MLPAVEAAELNGACILSAPVGFSNPPRAAIRILILYVTAGAGHRRAAEAMAQAVGAALPDARIECADFLDRVPRWLRRGYPWIYYVLVRHLAGCWGMAFTLLDRRAVYAVVQPIRRAWNRFTARRWIRGLRANPPDLIVATHFFPADVVASCKEAGWLRTPLLVVITDFYPHRFWLSAHADAYVCATALVAQTLEARGIEPRRVHALGIPIARAFRAPAERREAERTFGLEAGRQTILVTSGGSTVGSFEPVVRALASLERWLPGRAQLLAICGEDRGAARRLGRLAAACPMPVRVFGFIDNMPEAMSASDLVVSKAGGLTVTEALSRELPLILYHVIAGQETLNARHVVQQGAAIMAQRPGDVAEIVRRCLEDPARLTAMRQAARSIGRPDAAEAIASQVVKPLLRKA